MVPPVAVGTLPGICVLLQRMGVPLSHDFTDLLPTYALVWCRCTGTGFFLCRRRDKKLPTEKTGASLCPPPPRLSDLLFVRHGSALTSLVFRFGSLIGLLTELRIQNAEKIEGCTCFLDVLVPPHALLPLTASTPLYAQGGKGCLS